MAERIRFTRAQLAQFLPSLDLIKAFESLTAKANDTGTATDEQAAAIEQLRSDTDAGATLVAMAMADAAVARALAAEAQADTLAGQIGALREELAAARTDIAALQQGYQL